jgi:hypothetical protein
MHETTTAKMASGIERKIVGQNRQLTILSVPRAEAWNSKIRRNPHNGHTKDTIGIEETANRQFRNRHKLESKPTVGDQSIGSESKNRQRKQAVNLRRKLQVPSQAKIACCCTSLHAEIAHRNSVLTL